MKKTIMTMLSLFLTLSLAAQTADGVTSATSQTGRPRATSAKADTTRFMRECRAFGRFAEQAVLDKRTVDSLSVCHDTLIAHYRVVKPRLNDQQVEEYNRIRGRYTRRILEYRGERVGEGLQATGDSIAAKAGRVGKSIGGFFRGIFER